MTTFRPLVMLLLLVAAAPFASATSRPRVDVDLDVDADLQVAARATARADADLSYEWDWGDGEVSAGARARHAYGAAGEYAVTLTVRDEETGRCWTERRTVVVEASRARDDDEEEEDEDETEERGSRQSRASALVSVGGGRSDVSLDASVRLSRTRAAEDPDHEHGGEASLYARSDSSRHEAPGAGLALVLPALGGLAALFRRRG